MFGSIKYSASSISLIAFMKINYCLNLFGNSNEFSFNIPNRRMKTNFEKFQIDTVPFFKPQDDYVLKKSCFLKKNSCPSFDNSSSKCPNIYTEFEKVLTGLETIPSEIYNKITKCYGFSRNLSRDANLNSNVYESISTYIKNLSDTTKFFSGDFNSVIYNIDILFGLNRKNNSNLILIFDEYFVEWFVKRFLIFLNEYAICSNNMDLNQMYNMNSNIQNFVLLKPYENINDFLFSSFRTSGKNFLCCDCDKNTFKESERIFKEILRSSIITKTSIFFIDILLEQSSDAYKNCKGKLSKKNVANNYDLYFITIQESLTKMKKIIENNLIEKKNYVEKSVLLTSFATVPYTITNSNNTTIGSKNVTFSSLKPALIDMSKLPKYI